MFPRIRMTSSRKCLRTTWQNAMLEHLKACERQQRRWTQLTGLTCRRSSNSRSIVRLTKSLPNSELDWVISDRDCFWRSRYRINVRCVSPKITIYITIALSKLVFFSKIYFSKTVVPKSFVQNLFFPQTRFSQNCISKICFFFTKIVFPK